MTGSSETDAAWRHLGFREGFEVCRRVQRDSTVLLAGSTAAHQDGDAWVITYSIRVDRSLGTCTARVTRLGEHGTQRLIVERSPDLRWTTNGVARPDLLGCDDVDLESSVATNSLPIQRLALTTHPSAVSAPAVYVTTTLAVQRLDQTYRRLAPGRYEYRAPTFSFEAVLRYHDDGFLDDYPGLATRAH